MKTRSKALLLSLCAVLLVAASVLGTMAYLTDTQVVTNTFTVGTVAITLDETDVDKDDNAADNTTVNGVVRDKANSYKLLPGHTYIKDPTVTVGAGSEDSYIRLMVKVESLNQLKNAMPVKDYPTFYNGELFLLQNLCVDDNGALTWDGTKWEFEKFHETGTYENCYEFRYYTTVDGQGADGKEAAEKLEPLFTHITVPGEIDNTHLAFLKDVKIVVNAHAIQADGFADADEAWEAFK